MAKRTRRIAVVLVLAAAMGAGGWYAAQLGRRSTPLAGPRPAAWAEPLELPGVANFHRVSDDLYRGAQPSAEGIRHLREMGIKTVVNLRQFHADRDEIAGTGLGYVHIPMTAGRPKVEDVVRFLRVVTDETRLPVFVHCNRGADRTGMMSALYRAAVQGWPKDEAIREMMAGGFGFHEVFDEIPEFIRELDVQGIGRAAAAPGRSEGTQ